MSNFDMSTKVKVIPETKREFMIMYMLANQVRDNRSDVNLLLEEAESIWTRIVHRTKD
jgi:hypothetical protein